MVLIVSWSVDQGDPTHVCHCLMGSMSGEHDHRGEPHEGNCSYPHPIWRRAQIEIFGRFEFSCLTSISYMSIYGNCKIFINYAFVNRTVFQKSHFGMKYRALKIAYGSGNWQYQYCEDAGICYGKMRVTGRFTMPLNLQISLHLK